MFEEKLKALGEVYDRKHAELVKAQHDEFKRVVDEFIDSKISAENGSYLPTRSIFIIGSLHFDALPQPEIKKLALDNGLEIVRDGDVILVQGTLYF